jgi:deoxycytidylate deaminase
MKKVVKNKRKIQNCDLFVVRVITRSDGEVEFSNSKPCEHCTLAMKKYGVYRVYYTTGSEVADFEMKKVKDMDQGKKCRGQRMLSRNKNHQNNSSQQVSTSFL